MHVNRVPLICIVYWDLCKIEKTQINGQNRKFYTSQAKTNKKINKKRGLKKDVRYQHHEMSTGVEEGMHAFVALVFHSLIILAPW